MAADGSSKATMRWQPLAAAKRTERKQEQGLEEAAEVGQDASYKFFQDIIAFC